MTEQLYNDLWASEQKVISCLNVDYMESMSSWSWSHDKVEIYEAQSMCMIFTKAWYFGLLSHYVLWGYSYCTQDGQRDNVERRPLIQHIISFLSLKSWTSIVTYSGRLCWPGHLAGRFHKTPLHYLWIHCFSLFFLQQILSFQQIDKLNDGLCDSQSLFSTEVHLITNVFELNQVLNSLAIWSRSS